ncbi:hypothetical protein CSPARA_0261 [Campylobacter sputorum bv. paraureolyticus LMG 11764]|uniref:hypothetical protein n=3 Tax=Campylobacter sputorum TaxID=206 RepID=UPI000B7733FD|nr:hypothetical protein [Campylobacter sputorum]ASM37867.1 hypothetical protein CSPARA_0261 [Campylobacter sputorum bv. paraureolyticus LMG 11764]
MNISSLSSSDIRVNTTFSQPLPKISKQELEEANRIIKVNDVSLSVQEYERRQAGLINATYGMIYSDINATMSNVKINYIVNKEEINFRDNVSFLPGQYGGIKNEFDINYSMLFRYSSIYNNERDVEAYSSSFARQNTVFVLPNVEFWNIRSGNKYDGYFLEEPKSINDNLQTTQIGDEEGYIKTYERDKYFGLIDSNVTYDEYKNLSKAMLDTKPLNLNSYANSNLLKTPYGEVTIFYDEFDDNDKLGFGTFSSNSLLFNFDSNGDGIVDANDKLFNKLKVRGYDINGNEKIAKLSDVMPSINLRDFINDDIINYNDKYIDEYNSKYPHQKIDKSKLDYRLSYNASNPYTKFKAEYRYEMIEEKELNKFFEMYANEDGWVDLTNNHNAIFNKNSAFHNFAYMKKDLNGELSLSEFNPIFSDKKLDKDFSYTNYQKQNFMKFYDDYYKELNSHNKNIEWLSKNLKDYDVKDADIYIDKLKDIKSPYLIAMENEFKEATGLDFSLENLNKVKQAFDINKTKTANALKDTDSVVAMKLNKNGSITLKFNSGRQIVVNELYSDTGKLLGDKDTQVSVNLKAKNMNEDELNLLVSTKSDSIGIKTENNRYQTLKDLGVKSIKKLSNNKFILYLQDNTFITTKELYNITYIDRFLNDSSGLNNNSNSLNKNSNNNNSNLNLNDNNSNSLNLNNNINNNLNNHNELNSNNNINNSINNNGLNLDNNSSNLNNLSLNLNNTTNKTIHPNDMFYRKVDVRV